MSNIGKVITDQVKETAVKQAEETISECLKEVLKNKFVAGVLVGFVLASYLSKNKEENVNKKEDVNKNKEEDVNK